MTLDAFLDHFQGLRRVGARWTAACPAHDDRSRNTLNLGIGADGRRLVICRAGCVMNDILGAAKLKAADLFDDRLLGSVSQPIRRRDPWSLESVLRETLRRAKERAPFYNVIYPLGDAIRIGHAAVRRLRAAAVDTDAGWDRLGHAAALEREVRWLEAEQDRLIVEARRA